MFNRRADAIFRDKGIERPALHQPVDVVRIVVNNGSGLGSDAASPITGCWRVMRFHRGRPGRRN